VSEEKLLFQKDDGIKGPLKRCTKCGLELPVSKFSKLYNTGKERLHSWCKSCCNKSSKKIDWGNYVPKRRNPRVKHHIQEHRIAKRLFKRARDSVVTTKRKLEFSLTMKWVIDKVIEFSSTKYCQLVIGDPFMPSLDRIDSAKGYTIENTKVVWAIENYAKNDYTEEQLLEFCRRKLGLQQ